MAYTKLTRVSGMVGRVATWHWERWLARRRPYLAIPIEVELANKSKSRLDAILNLHTNWIIANKSAALIYICGDEEGYRRIERAADRVGLPADNGLVRIELLDTIKTQTRIAFEQARAGITTAAYLGPAACRIEGPSCLRVNGSVPRRALLAGGAFDDRSPPGSKSWNPRRTRNSAVRARWPVCRLGR